MDAYLTAQGNKRREVFFEVERHVMTGRHQYDGINETGPAR